MTKEELEKIATDAARKALEDALEEWYEPAERKPREWWIRPNIQQIFDYNAHYECIHVREVMPDEFAGCKRPEVDDEKI